MLEIPIYTPESKEVKTQLSIRNQRKESKMPSSFEEREPTSADLIELSRKLPESDRRVEMNEGVYDIYWAKSSDQEHFKSPVFEAITQAARWSYRKYYGPSLPLIDQTDAISDIYLVKFTSNEEIEKDSFYGKLTMQTEYSEYSSLRFIPNNHPTLNEDFQYYVFHNGREQIPIHDFVKGYYPDLSEEEFKKAGVTLSRFCPVRPFPTRYLSGNTTQLFKEAAKAKKSNDTLGIPFALMNEQYFLDHSDQDIRFVTCQMHDELANGILSYPPGTGELVMPFTPASQFFGVPEKSLRIDRKKAPIAYEVPGYFLNRPELVKRIDEHVVAGNLPHPETIQGLLPEGITWEKIKEHPRLGYFVNFGPKLLTLSGLIEGSGMSGEDLRNDLDQTVSDGARWRFIDAQSVWVPGVNDFISDINRKYKADHPTFEFIIPGKVPLFEYNSPNRI